jgi:putative PEP-CTERM system TPR-repeat lipoprotein
MLAMMDLDPETEPKPRLTRGRLILLATALVVTASTWSVYYYLTDKDAADYLQSAETYAAQGDTKAAIIALKNALQLEPEHAEARYRLGRLYVGIQDYLAAEKELKRAREQGHAAPDLPVFLARTWLALGQPERVLAELPVQDGAAPEQSAALLALRARAQWLSKDVAAAEASLQQAEVLHPGNTETLLTRAMMSAAGGAPERALALVDQALGQASKRADIWMFKGDLERQGRHTAKAQTAYRKALQLDPDYVPARIALALTHIETNALDAASRELGEAAKRAPNDIMVRYLQALIDFRQERLADAQSKLQQVLRLAPDFLPAHLLSGAVHLALGNLNLAITHLTRVVEQVPGHLPARKLLAAAMAQEGKLDQAGRLIAALKDSDDLLTLSLKGEIALRQGDPAGARRHLEQAIALSPDDPNLQLALAQSRLAGGDREGAIEALERAAELDDDSSRPDVLLVQAHLQAGRSAEALAVIDRMQKARPRDPLPHNLRGIVYATGKDTRRARASFAQALDLDPTFLPAAANLARLDLQENDPAAARRRFEAILAKDPRNARAHIALARLALADKNERAFLDHLAKARQADAKDPTAYYLLPRHWLGKRDVAKAMAEARAGLDATGRAEFHEVMGQAHLLNQDALAAANAFGKWVEASPDTPLAHYHLARAQQLNKATTDALRSLDRALALAPDLAEAVAAKATLLADTGRATEGLKLATELQRRQPQSPAGYAAQAEILAKIGRHVEVGDLYVKAAELARDSRLAVRAHESYARAGQDQRGEAWLERWLTSHPDDHAVRHSLALSQLRAGRLKEAAAHYERLYKAHPRNPVVVNNLAWLYGELKDPRALQLAEQAHKLDPDNPATLDTLGWILVHANQPRRGLQLLEQAHKSAPDSPQILWHYAAALARYGDRNNARAKLEGLVDSKLDFPERGQAEKLLEELRRAP